MNTGPDLGLLQERVDAWDAGLPQDFSVRHLVLPLDVKESAETAQVKMVELFGVPTIHGPGLAGVQEGGEHHGTVDFQLCSDADSPAVPYVLPKSPKGSAGF